MLYVFILLKVEVWVEETVKERKSWLSKEVQVVLLTIKDAFANTRRDFSDSRPYIKQ